MRPSSPPLTDAINAVFMLKINPCRPTVFIVVGLLALFIFTTPTAFSAPSPDPTTGIKKLVGSERRYNLSFLWFDHLASGELSFIQDPSHPKRYRALLEAKTLGVAAWLTGDRIQRYETIMEITPQGRLQPLEYKSRIYKKKGGAVTEQSKFYTFDLLKQTITLIRSKDHKKGIEEPVKTKGRDLPIDFLTAGFNFISGVYGPIQVGERKTISTFTHKGEQEIVIEALRPNDWPTTPFFKSGRGTLVRVTLPTEILDTDGGSIYALLDDQFLPQRVIVENVLGLGEVRGELQ